MINLLIEKDIKFMIYITLYNKKVIMFNKFKKKNVAYLHYVVNL